MTPEAVRGTVGCGLVAALLIAATAQAQSSVFSPARYVSGDFPMVSPLVVAGGEVYLDVIVETDGRAGPIEVVRSTPPFTDALVTTVRRWQFTPAQTTLGVVASHLLIAAMFASPTVEGPTLGQPPQDAVASTSDVPVPLSTVPAAYPPRATGNGTVLVEVTINDEGLPVSARVVVSSPAFDEAALMSSRQWSFRPARQHGRAVTTHAYLLFAFTQPVMVRAGRAPR